MTRHGEDYTLTQEKLDDIALYMDEDIREELHGKLAPCTPEAFLHAYIEKVPEFEELLKNEFSIEM